MRLSEPYNNLFRTIEPAVPAASSVSLQTNARPSRHMLPRPVGRRAILRLALTTELLSRLEAGVFDSCITNPEPTHL
jgi:hypothetical protein